MEAGEFEARGLGMAGHEIETLNGVARRSFDEVVEGRENDEASAALLEGEADLAEIRPGADFRLGDAIQAAVALDDPDERLQTVIGPIGPPGRPFFRERSAVRKDMDGGQDAADRFDGLAVTWRDGRTPSASRSPGDFDRCRWPTGL
jgi:hypothetical protein